MQSLLIKNARKHIEVDNPKNEKPSIEQAIKESWDKIAPFWPLKNLIAVNPIAGFEDLPFEDALKQAHAYFQQKDMPKEMQHINRESIKWLQVFFDEGQSTIQMPLRQHGLLKSTLSLLRFDNRLITKASKKNKWLEKTHTDLDALIGDALRHLGITSHDQAQFLTLMLTTLPGWAAHVQYRTNWPDAQDMRHPNPVTQKEYLAFRLILTCLIWPNAKQLLLWHKKALENAYIEEKYKKIKEMEATYQQELLNKLKNQDISITKKRASAQIVFCIDVRSEPFRRRLEAQGNYETYGFAGFFGLPVSIQNAITGESHASCPVLLKPKHLIVEKTNCLQTKTVTGYKNKQIIKKIYQSVKYTFITPFSLVETIGIGSGCWMALKSFMPNVASKIKSKIGNIIAPTSSVTPIIESLTLEQQVAYGSNALKMMGLTNNFSKLVVFCGHGSTTQNNAYKTALDCGACGGNHGAPNARILANILNNEDVRNTLKKHNIYVPADTFFIAAEHNTTTDNVQIYHENSSDIIRKNIIHLQKDLDIAKNSNSTWRSAQLGMKVKHKKSSKETRLRSQDWAQVRPEWGLARNAAFIIGPRELTKDIDLQGRAFLHSYNWREDENDVGLTAILTAPMIVAQWINAQYFFSTFDNVAYGSGSKITKNITGKIGIIQGNASDLMHGLPLQSVYKNDLEPYHQPIRLTVVVYAPKTRVDLIIKQQDILQKLFGNGWIHLICYDPKSNLKFTLERNLSWLPLTSEEKLLS